ncbi:MAG: hypothetical protein E7062_09835 [Spirochaetaceae bacterium]|nr:hypothetical protein [Spirochaetaceae bacterium]
MNKSLQRIVVFLAIFVLIGFFGCKSTEVEEPTEEVLVSTFTSDWAESIFSEQDQHGYFFTTPELGHFSMIEGEFKKSGGYEKSSFGFVFGYTADSEGWLSDYLRFEINTAGEYAVFACNGNSYTDLVEANEENTAYMYTSASINTGYDTVNKLKIEKKADSSYDLYINGTKCVSVKAPEGFSNSDGIMAFFSVGKQNQEQFPDEPVRVTYRITDSANTNTNSTITGEK